MCLTCGCGDLFNDHGNPRNITMQQLQDAANAASITVPEALRNIQQGVSEGLRGMTDWTGSQQDTGALVNDTMTEPRLSSALPPPSPGERSPGS
jgi:hypothetical protein